MAEASTPGRPMKFPYTLSAKIAQFPHTWFIKESPIMKWWLISCLICAPLFYKIQKLSKTPSNVAKWEEVHRQEFSGHHH